MSGHFARLVQVFALTLVVVHPTVAKDLNLQVPAIKPIKCEYLQLRYGLCPWPMIVHRKELAVSGW